MMYHSIELFLGKLPFIGVKHQVSEEPADGDQAGIDVLLRNNYARAGFVPQVKSAPLYDVPVEPSEWYK